MHKIPVPLASSHAVRLAHTMMIGHRQHARPSSARLTRVREMWLDPANDSVRRGNAA